ncbi:MAG: hypothetical protein AAF637_10505 [Pseudomonadota bacterium]
MQAVSGLAGPGAGWLALVAIVAPIYYFGAFAVYGYATSDLVDGRWVSQIISFLRSGEDDLPQLLGARSRFLWLGLVMLYVPLILSVCVFSLVIVARRTGEHARVVVGGLIVVALAFGGGVWLLAASQIAGCLTDACGPGCATTSGGYPFSIIRYLGGVFCQLYDPAFVAFFRGYNILVGPVHMIAVVLFFAAVLSLTLGRIDQWRIEDLRQRVSDFLVILLLGSALFTYMALLELTLWGWFVEIADGWAEVGALQNLQLGSTLFWGMTNSALMLLVFAPIGLLLARQSRVLAEHHNDGASPPELEAWEREHGITLHGRALWTQFGGMLAPLLTGALAFLFERAVG